jgi:hypothetical protein
MHKRATQALVFLSLSLPQLVQAQVDDDGYASLADNGEPRKSAESASEPSSGVALTVVGGVALGIGAINLATIPICSANFYPRDAKDACVVASVTFGVIGVGVGLPLLLVGINQRSKYKAWRQAHPVLSAFDLHLDRGRAELVFDASF